jgi:hypothetical protein
MNFRIVFHLYATEWQRLRKPLVAYLMLLAFPFAVFVLGYSDGFRHPAPWESGGDQITQNYGSLLWSNPWLRGMLLWGQLAGLLMAGVLAASIGIHGQSSAALRPVRGRERVAARTLCLLAFFVFPQCLLLACQLWLGGYDAVAIAKVVAMHGACALAYLGAALCFGAWCGGYWAGMAGLVVTLSLISLVKSLLPVPEWLGLGLFKRIAWGAPVGWGNLAYAALLIFLLGGLLPWFRHRCGVAGRVAWCAVLASAAMVLLGQLPPSWWLQQAEPAPSGISDKDFPTIRPALRFASLQRQQSYSRTPDGLRLAAQVDSLGVPPGYGVVWRRAGETSLGESRPGGAAASRKMEFPERKNAWQGMHFSPITDPNREALIAGTLSTLGGKQATSTNALQRWGGSRHDLELGFLSLEGNGEKPRQESARVDTQLAGWVYRYRIVLDIPISDHAVEHTEAGRKWRVRRFPAETETALVDVAMTRIRTSFGVNANAHVWESNRMEDLEFFYYLPQENLVLPAERRFGASGLVLTGEYWERRVFGPEGHGLQGAPKQFDITGMRMIALRAEVVALLPTMVASGMLTGENRNEAGHDFQLSMRYGLELRSYRQKLATERPDPQTCTAEEFGRWLRVAAGVTPTYDSPSVVDLSMFAPRFAEIMVKVPHVPTVREALFYGLPEQRRDAVLDAIRDTAWPDALIEVAVRRGWTQEAADAILARFHAGDEISSEWLMALENPVTYPYLLERLRNSPDLALHENLRLLPGIEPMLEESIRSAISSASLRTLLNRARLDRNRHPFGPYLLAAKRGDAAALDAVLQIFTAGGTEGASYYSTSALGHLFPTPPARNGSVNLGWQEYLAEKSAQHFQFDPLARSWFPR